MIYLSGDTETVFSRENFSDRRQLQLIGLSLLLTFLSTELDFMPRIFNLTSLTLNQWLIGIGASLLLILVSEVVKFCIRRRKAK